MSWSALWLLCSLFLVNAEDDANSSCPPDFRYANTNTTINITESCKEKACIAKCCPGNQTLFWNQRDTRAVSCNDLTNLTNAYNLIDLEYPELEIYDKNIEREIIKTATNIKQFIRVYSDNFIYTQSCINVNLEEAFPAPTYLHYILETHSKPPNENNGKWSYAIPKQSRLCWTYSIRLFHTYTNGSLVIRRVNYFYQWWIEFSPGQFCVDHQVVVSDGNVSTELVIRFIVSVNSEEDLNQENTLSAYGLLVSCVFLFLVLAVYALLPELRNMAGLMLMAYVTTLTAAFITRVVLVLSSDNDLLDWNACVFIGFIQYYTILASFTWMNVMSFDIWWTMRGFRKLRQIHRRGVLVKLGWYGLYGWGTPLLPVIFMIVVENIDMTHLPNFVTPHYSNSYNCFMEEGERLLYMNGPILITTCINLTLFFMTAYNIWRIKRGVSQHSDVDSRINKKNETRFGIYLKLSLVMGINWVLEVVGSVYKPDSSWWYAPDAFNALVGLFIFIIFVCKTKVIVLLCKRLSIGNELVLKLQSADSTRTESMRLNERKSRNTH